MLLKKYIGDSNVCVAHGKNNGLACMQAGNLSGGHAKAEGYAAALLQALLCQVVVPAGLQGNAGISSTAMAVISRTVDQTRNLSGDDGAHFA